MASFVVYASCLLILVISCIEANPVCNPICPMYKCMECPDGYTPKQDHRGCPTCQCVPDKCDGKECLLEIACENGFTYDSRGCRTCDCAEAYQEQTAVVKTPKACALYYCIALVGCECGPKYDPFGCQKGCQCEKHCGTGPCK